MTITSAEQAAMRRALALATTPGVPTGPNPRVGCVLLDADGRTVAEGWHRGAGSPHAEVDALTAAATTARGSTAVVTLEPCNHVGRTGPCSQALVDAGVRRVVYAQRDPNPRRCREVRPPCARPVSRSRVACWRTRPARSTASGRSPWTTAAPS